MKKEYWLLFLIIIIAAFLRLVNLSTIPPGLYPDEAMNGNNALEALATNDWKVFYPENNGREGLFINIQSVFLTLFGNEPWVLRLPSALFGILTVLGLYFLTRELFRAKIFSSLKPPEASGHGSIRQLAERERAEDKQADSLGQRSGLKEEEILALIATFLLATSFWHINFSRIGFRAIMAPFFLIWGVYLFLLVLNKIQTASASRRIWRTKFLLLPLLAGAIYGLGLHSYIAYRAAPLLILFIIAAYWLKNKDRLIRKQILLSTFYFLLSSIIVFLPLGLHFLNNPADFFGRTTQISIFNSPTPVKDLTLNTIKTVGMFNFAGDYNWRHNLAGQPQLFWPVGIMFVIGIFWGVKNIFQKKPRQIPSIKHQAPKNNFGIWNLEFGILFTWFVVAALPVVVSNEAIPHALRAIIMIPPVFILSGVGGMAIYNFFAQRIKSTYILKTASFVLLLFILFATYYTYFIRWAKNPNTAGAFSADYLEIGRKLNSLPPEQPKYVIVNASGVDVRGIPMPAQTVMFITDTFTPAKQEQKNIHYLIPNQIKEIHIPEGAYIIQLD